MVGCFFTYSGQYYCRRDQDDGMKVSGACQGNEPRSPLWRDCLWAFVIGGICTLGQLFVWCCGKLGLEKQDASTAASMSLVALSALLTGLSLYDGRCQNLADRRPGNCVRCICVGSVWRGLLDNNFLFIYKLFQRFFA